MNDSTHTVSNIILERRSPYAFSEEELSDDDLNLLFEAARWAPSSYNEQPWRFFVGRKGDDAYSKILSTLVDANAAWATQAPVLVIAATSTHFSRNDKVNGHARYDLGQAVASMGIVAWAHGIALHQMAGFSANDAITALDLPEGIEAVTAIAIGKIADPTTLNEEALKKEEGPRQRRALTETVFGSNMQSPASFSG